MCVCVCVCVCVYVCLCITIISCKAELAGTAAVNVLVTTSLGVDSDPCYCTVYIAFCESVLFIIALHIL